MKSIFDTPETEIGKPSLGMRETLTTRAISKAFGDFSSKTHAIIQGNLFGSVVGTPQEVNIETLKSPRRVRDNKTRFTHSFRNTATPKTCFAE